MNYLAHLFLSERNASLVVGNFIADQVKGNTYLAFEPAVATGILLHREIDSFMDNHELVQKGKERLYDTQGKFAGVVMDVFYDYFLCKNWKRFSDDNYPDFVSEHYTILEENSDVMPSLSQYIMERMIRTDWLGSYPSINGIDRALKGLSTRTKYPNNMHKATSELLKYEQELELEFSNFFPDIVAHCKQFIFQHGET